MNLVPGELYLLTSIITLSAFTMMQNYKMSKKLTKKYHDFSEDESYSDSIISKLSGGLRKEIHQALNKNDIDYFTAKNLREIISTPSLQHFFPIILTRIGDKIRELPIKKDFSLMENKSIDFKNVPIVTLIKY